MSYETCKNCGDYLYEGSACCFRKDAVLQRERAIKAEAILAELMSIVPFGNIKTHTRENLPGRVQDFLAELAEMTCLAEKAEEENKSLIVKKSARENLLMEALLQGSAAGVSFAGTALNDWLDHAKRLTPHQFVSFEDSLSRETSFLARAEKAEAELARMIEERDEANSKYLSTRKEIENMRSECTSLDTELAKREKALKQLAYVYNADMDGRQGPQTHQAVDRLTDRVVPHSDNLPELAEWLKNKERDE